MRRGRAGGSDRRVEDRAVLAAEARVEERLHRAQLARLHRAAEQVCGQEVARLVPQDRLLPRRPRRAHELLEARRQPEQPAEETQHEPVAALQHERLDDRSEEEPTGADGEQGRHQLPGLERSQRLHHAGAHPPKVLQERDGEHALAEDGPQCRRHLQIVWRLDPAWRKCGRGHPDDALQLLLVAGLLYRERRRIHSTKRAKRAVCGAQAVRRRDSKRSGDVDRSGASPLLQTLPLARPVDERGGACQLDRRGGKTGRRSR